MRRRRTRRKTGAAMVLLALGLTACGGGGFSDGGSGGGRDKTLRVLVNITPNLTQEFWNDLVEPFEKAHDGVNVKIEAPTGTGVADTLQQQLAAGDAPDIVETLVADETLAPKMLDLTDRTWVADTPLAKEAMLDGKAYTVGVGEQAQSLVFYNKEAFAEAGITRPPSTLDELTAAMGKLKKAGRLPLRTAGDFVTGLQLLQLANPSLAQSRPGWYGQVRDEKLTVGQVMLPYLRLYKTWLDRGYLDKNALGLKYADAETDFLAGRSAMYVMGSWFTAAEAEADKDFEVGVFPAPVAKGQRHPGPQGTTMSMPYMILKDSGQRKLALELVKWLVTDKKAVDTQLRQDGNFRRGSERTFSTLEREVQKILDEAPESVAQGEGYGEDTLPRGFNAAWNTAVQSLYTGRSPDDAAKAVDRWVRDRS
ncbi:ABC transporter substrate-binding protein [Streptomyces sp. NPDC005970]|uniref:ABC transporter substrate-binding protein n=1 Tax=Streptomyces sp. NPDC005970 TaxID=3156723 RepID=UPI0033E1D929